MSDLPNGTTRQVHVEHMLKEASGAIERVRLALLDQRMTRAQCEALSRRLAGVIGNCESIRIWLNAGAPR